MRSGSMGGSGRQVGFVVAVVTVSVCAVLISARTPAFGSTGPLSQACPPEQVHDSAFTDTAGNTHEAAIDCLVWYEVTRGVAAEQYGPARTVTRGQMASFMARAMGQATDLPDPSPQGFRDVAGNAHEARILQLSELGVVRGLTADTYGPARPVSRGQMATFLVRAVEHLTGQPLPDDGDHFDDDDNNPHEDNINKAAGAGLTRGASASAFSPAASVRRDQMASFIARMLDRLVTGGHMSAEPEPQPDPDPPPRQQAGVCDAYDATAPGTIQGHPEGPRLHLDAWSGPWMVDHFRHGWALAVPYRWRFDVVNEDGHGGVLFYEDSEAADGDPYAHRYALTVFCGNPFKVAGGRELGDDTDEVATHGPHSPLGEPDVERRARPGVVYSAEWHDLGHDDPAADEVQRYDYVTVSSDVILLHYAMENRFARDHAGQTGDIADAITASVGPAGQADCPANAGSCRRDRDRTQGGTPP